MRMPLAPLFSPPYFAVIFTSLRTEGDADYGAMAERMEELAREQSGYLGIDSARSEAGITVSYWRDLESVRSWKQQWEHRDAQRQGREKWYEAYTVRVCRVEHEYDFAK
jgi:heme-degrading monooxygenase HmoA